MLASARGDDTMPDKRRILITGIDGLIGRALDKALREKGYDVWGIDRVGNFERQVLEANLLNREETLRAVAQIEPFDVVIHTAALAHGEKTPSGASVYRMNTEMTRNLLEAVKPHSPRFIFFSSVSVYGEDGRLGPVRATDKPKPSSEYGRSKLACEKMLLESSLTDCDILRLAPVFDKSYLINVKRRVFLPGVPRVKMRLYPSPKHSLCHLDTVVQTVCRLLEVEPSGRQTQNICDVSPYDQKTIASWFPGVSVPIPVCAVKPLYYLLYLLPRNSGHAMRCLYWKLFCSNEYSTNPGPDFNGD